MTDFFPGLEGVPAAKSRVGFIDGENGILEYRGIRIEELVEKSNFIETAYLLIFGKLPTKGELEKFDSDLRNHRRIKYRIIDLMKSLPEHGHPMDALQATVAALGMFYPAKDVSDEETNYWSIVRLIAKLPTIVAAFARMRHGDEAVKPRDDLSHTENFFYMLTEREPDPYLAKVLDICLLLHAEHTMNASTFSGLVTASTLADPYTVVSSAIGTLTGPLHGGANERVVEMLKEIGSIENVKGFVENKLKNKEKIMGLGHRVYKTYDPRAKILHRIAREMEKRYGEIPLLRLAEEVERVSTEFLKEKRVYPNVDFYSGIVYDRMGIPTDIFTCIFAIARVAGWLAHWMEQLSDNRIFRPTEIYVGEHNLHYISVEERG